MPRLRAVWAVAELAVTLATAAWGAYLLVTTHAAAWPGGVFAAAAFFLVATVLFAADHRDGRVVGLFGVAVFVLTNALLIYALLPTSCSTGSSSCVAHPGVLRLQLDPHQADQLPWVVAAATAVVAVPQALLVAFGHRRREDLAGAGSAPMP